ncbi:hypothetical protein PENSPDRAFT_438326 [Peniophora sp. CONT]|nr:hypothetical protein PENSPDRAFT_438326 [Peniophora sp. CONT]
MMALVAVGHNTHTKMQATSSDLQSLTASVAADVKSRVSGSSPSRDDLLRPAKALCEAFASASPPDQILTHLSSNPTAIEHGEPSLLPGLRLGTPYTGLNGVKSYFSAIAELFSFETMRFEDWTVDTEVKVATVRGRAVFTWKSTGQSWDENFMYRLAMVDEDEGWKVGTYEVWADTGAAVRAMEGKLRQH